MKVKKVLLLLLLALLLIFAVVSATVANTTVEGRTRNVITTGKVDISINESTKAANGVIRADGKGIDFSAVVPGQTASKIVTIKNEAEKCWLRVKVEITVTPAPGDGSDPAQLIVPNIDGSLWRYENGYYYYQKPLESGETAAMFDQVLFAPSIGNAYAGSQAKMVITAEATQYKNNETMSPESWPAEGEGTV